MSNEAAERLRSTFHTYGNNLAAERLLDAALAAERRALVERIRAALLAWTREADWDAEEAAAASHVLGELDALLTPLVITEAQR